MYTYLRALLPALVLTLAVLPRAEASALVFDRYESDPQIPTINGQVNSLSCESQSSGFDDCTIDKTFTGPDGQIAFIIYTKAAGTLQLNETVHNNSGETWSDYHWGIFPEDTTATMTISSVTNYGPFSTLSKPFPTVASVAGGTLGTTLSFTPIITLSVSGAGQWHFVQFPTVDAPEPATLGLLGLGLVGIAAASRRRVAAA